MWSCIGYLRLGSKSGGVMYQPWIFMPSPDVYRISATRPSFRPARTSSLTAVSCLMSDGALRSKLTTSPGFEGDVRTPTALHLLPMSDTPRMGGPFVRGDTLPPAAA